MGYNRGAYSEDYYDSPALTSQVLEARSSSVSSTSSAASSSTAHQTIYTHHAGISRTLSPASSTSGSETNNGIYSRNQYPGFGHEHLHTPQPDPPSLPSQYLQPQIASFPSPYPPVLSARHSSRSSPYGGYPVGVLHQQSSPLSYDSYPSAMYPLFSATSYHSPPALPPQQATPIDHPPSASTQRDSKTSSGPVDSAEDFEQSFDDVLSLLEAERNPGHSNSEESGTSKPGKSNSKEPWGLACYHCLKLKLYHQFELMHRGPPSAREAGDADEETETRSSTPGTTKRERSGTPPASSTSPSSGYYDPTVTRASLKESAARNGRRAGQACARSNPRIKKTYGIRRFCIQCGLRLGIYEPRDVIEVQRPRWPGEAYWICDCRKLLRRDGEEARCEDCNSCAPFSSPSD
ncbi:hypothetical protein N657DRAFT_71507 [Parathielavia appendiculata]|uniref:Uncharacterized protein n=1 Tax=Parathielavia appendiculata TaxID=2587402 RepID=A0AAN6UAD4_9PEZI|nr:hypothetical protein N657DRAFT_71507 [Parathielavia appendiculata]